MTLSPGTILGRYEIRSQLGAGGMGEVYLARDPKIGRDVAIKVLPAALSADPERLHRFEQEAQAAGALNHPNILSIYDVDTHDGAPYVVSELLEGETLRECLDGGPIAQRKAIDYAIQVAHGLAAAHEKGIVHRDLKPENIFITKEGRAKILDFGLAKLIERSDRGDAQTDLPTRRVRTDPGTVMGTVGYMSPEQLRSEAADHRSDLFSFGAILYEMLSGQRAFQGKSTADAISAILREDPPDPSTTNSTVAPALDRIVGHCLEKNREGRFQSARDVGFALEALSRPSGSAATAAITVAPLRAKNRERLVWIAVTALLFLATAVFAYFSRSPAIPRAMRLALVTPDKIGQPARITISPDGLRVVFIGNNAEGKRLLWVRPLDSLSAQQLAGTEGAFSPFWSPDSRFIGYFANSKLFKIDAAAGRPQVLCEVAESEGAAWSPNGVIIFSGPEGLYRVPASGGTPALATKVDSKEEGHRWPYFLSDGRRFVFLADAERTEDHHIRLGSLDSQDTQILFSAVSRVAYAPPGYLLFVNQGALVAQPFDAQRLKTTGDPITVAERVLVVGDNHEFDFSVSDNGVLTYQSGNPDSQLTWFDRAGKKLGPVGEPANYSMLSLSPDGRRAAVELLDADGRVGDVWLVDITRGSTSRLTFDPQSDGGPIWSPDGNRIVFNSNRAGGGQIDLYHKAATGAGDEQLLFQSDGPKLATSWSRDGQKILFTKWPPKAKSEIWLLPVSANGQAKPFLQTTAFDQAEGQFSTDGRFVAYDSNESGRWEVYVQTFPLSGDKWQISSGGGRFSSWRGDGKELFYISNDKNLRAVDVRAGKTLEIGVPKTLFPMRAKIGGGGYSYAATADGQRFLINTLLEGNNPAPITIVINWTVDLKH